MQIEFILKEQSPLILKVSIMHKSLVFKEQSAPNTESKHNALEFSFQRAIGP